MSQLQRHWQGFSIRRGLESQGADLQEVLEPSARQQKLADYQQEMQDFTTFLKQRYWAPVEEEVIHL